MIHFPNKMLTTSQNTCLFGLDEIADLPTNCLLYGIIVYTVDSVESAASGKLSSS